MKKAKKLLAALVGAVMLVSCMTTSVFAAETGTQDGLKAVIQTDKESYAANEDIQITVTITNTNTFEVKNVSIESLLPDALTLKDGDLKSKTVDLKPGETLSISFVAVLEKDEPTTIVPTTTEPVTEPPATTEPGTTQPEETTTEETPTEATTETTTVEPTTAPDTTETDTETPSTTEQTETTTDSSAILPVEPSTTEPTTGIIEGELTTVDNTPDNPDTGSGLTIIKVLLIALAAAAVVAAIILITRKNSKKATKVISLVLCGAIAVSSFATVGFIKVGAEERTQFSFFVDKTITVDSEEYTIQANITYDKEESKDYQELIDGVDIDSVYEDKDADTSLDLKTGIQYINNIIIINFDWDCTDERKAEVINSIHGKVVGGIEGLNELHIQIDKSSLEELENLIDFLNENNDDIYASYDEVSEYSFGGTSYAPNDSWGEDGVSWENTNPTEYSTNNKNWWALATNLRQAWGYDAYFNEINIGIIDDGFANNHEDINLQVVSKENSPGNHGTHIAGIIGATQNNGKGITGIISKSQIYGYDVANEKGKIKKDSEVYKALETLVTDYHCKVINLSMERVTYVKDGKCYIDKNKIFPLTDAEQNSRAKKASRAIAQLLENNDFIIVQAAGNGDHENNLGIDSDKAGFFAAITAENCYSNDTISVKDIMDRIIVVANAEKPYSTAEFRLNKSSNAGNKVDIAAPGTSIYSTVAGIEEQDSKGNIVISDGQQYALMTGTSMAAPIVTGIAGLVWSVNLDFSGATVKDIICNSVDNNIVAADNLESPTEGTYFLVNAQLSIEEALRQKYQTFKITGNIVNQSDKALSGVNIKILDSKNNNVITDITAHDGKYSFTLPANGKYSIEFLKDGYSSETFTLPEDIAPEQIIDLGTTVMMVSVLSKVSGVVLDSGTNSPVEGVIIEALDMNNLQPESIATTTTDKEGKFYFNLPFSHYVLTLTHPEYDYKEIEIDVQSPETILLMPIMLDTTRPQIDSGFCGDNLTWVLYEDGELIISGRGEMYNYQHPVYGGAAPWNKYDSKIKHVIIEDGVTTIGDCAFLDTNLNSIELPNTLLSIGNLSFWLSNLSSVVIPDSVTVIESDAFLYCKNLKSVVIGNGVKEIGNWFGNCTNLTDIVIGGNVETIGASVFSDCPLESLEIPNSVTSIGAGAFAGCHFESIILPSSITKIEDRTFSYCPNLRNVTIPDTITYIGYTAFEGDYQLEGFDVDIKNQYYCSPGGVLYNKEQTRLMMYPPQKKSTSYTIPMSVTTISDNAFAYCSNLKNISLPSSITEIPVQAFSNCSNLMSIRIPDGVTSIGAAAFSDCYSLESVSIPDSLTSIGDSIFYGCSSLTSISIPNNVHTIPGGAFKNCSSLRDINLPVEVNKIGSSAFENCSSLNAIIIPDGVPSIERRTFYGCSSLKEVILPESVSAIQEEAFARCTNLKSITILNRECKIVSLDDTITNAATIYGYKNSTAEHYALRWAKKFIPLD